MTKKPNKRSRTQSATKSSNSKIGKSYESISKAWLIVIPIIISALALYFQWQAHQQTSENLLISDIRIYGGGLVTNVMPTALSPNVNVYPELGHSYCNYKIRFTNNGGASTSILDFKANSTYKNQVASLEGYGETSIITKQNNPFSNLPIAKLQSIMVLEEIASKQKPDINSIDSYETGIGFPFKIDAYSSVDVVIYTIATVDPLAKDILFLSGFEKPANDKEIKTLYQQGLSPIRMSFIFQTSSNRQISTESMECWFAAVFPPNTKFEVLPESSATP